MTRDEMIYIFDDMVQAARDIMALKNRDYANEHALKNFMAYQMVDVSPARGVLSRMVDKISRLGELEYKSAAVVSESTRDTIIDLINYAVLLECIHQYEARNSGEEGPGQVEESPEPQRVDDPVEMGGQVP